MNAGIRSLLLTLLNRKIIGSKHTLESNMIKTKIRWLSRAEKSSFNKEYQGLLKDSMIIRKKKKTGKSFDWHISLNPRMLHTVMETIK